MAFELFESSRERGEPINLFKFTTGPRPQDVIPYTDAEHDIVVIEGDGLDAVTITYKAMPIQRTAYTMSGRSEDNTSLGVDVPRYSEIAELFRVYPPSYVVGLILYQGHANDPDKDYLAVWTGRVLSCKFEGLSSRLTCESTSTSMQRPGLRRNYQYACPHVLYGPLCRAAKVPRDLVCVSKPNAAQVIASFDGLLGEADEKFIGGTLEWETEEGRREVRNIRDVGRVGDNLLLNIGGSNIYLPVGAPMVMLLGCRHDLGDCVDTFNNILNYGGQPWIPLKNPIGITGPFI